MARIDDLQTALINADKAGDSEAAKILANEIISLRNQAQPQQELSQDTWSQYFNGQLSPQDKMNIENQVKAGQIKLPSNITSNISQVPTSPERPQDTGVVLQKEYTPMEKIQAGLQASGGIISSTAAGLAGNTIAGTNALINNMYNLVTGQTEKSAEQAKQYEQQAKDFTNQLNIYQPEDKLAQEYMQTAASALEPLTAIAPMNLGIVQSAKLARETPQPKVGDIYQAKQQTISEAGITPMTSDIAPPTTSIGKTAQSITEKIPFTGTGVKRAEQQGQRVSAIKDLADELGYRAEDVTSNVTQDLLNKRSRTISKFSNMKKNIFEKIDERMNIENEKKINNGEMPTYVDTTKTINSIDEQINKIRGLGLAENEKAVTTLEDFKQAFQNKNLTQLDDLRKSLGDKLNDEGLTSVKSVLEKSSKKVYDTLKEDIGDHIKQNGDKKDFTKWQVANKSLSDSMGELEVSALKNVLNKGSATPEKINSMIFSKTPSEQKLLFNNLSQEGRANARIAIINKIINDSGGENLSTAKFITNLKNNDISINTFFKQKDIEKIKGLNKALELTRRSEEAGLNPPTGLQALIPVTFSGLGASLGTVGGAAAGFGIGVLGRIYESQPVSNLLIKIGKAPKTQETQLFKMLNDEVSNALKIESLNQNQEKE